MNIDYLVQLLGNRLNALILAKDQAFMAGDLERINLLDTEMFSVQDTLSKLKLLQNASQEAAVTNSTLVEAMKVPVTVVANGSAECMNLYDLSSYATDPLHEQKIADILTTIGPMETFSAIDEYINNEAIGSPVTGQMIMAAAGVYKVDVRLMMAIMELDSRFGTAGVAVRTFNPGNVGNTGTETRTYASWNDGVLAVAQWLSNHRKVQPVIETVLPEEPKSNPVESVASSTPSNNATSTPTTIETATTTAQTDPIVPPLDIATTTPVFTEIATSTNPVPITIDPEATTTPITEATTTPTSSELP
jgi:hypothetical protein